MSKDRFRFTLQVLAVIALFGTSNLAFGDSNANYLAECMKQGNSRTDCGGYDVKNSSPSAAGATAGAGASAQKNESCKSVVETAEKACVLPGTDGMSTEEQMQYQRFANEALQLGTRALTAGENMSEQCSIQSMMQGALAGINGVKGVTCGKQVSKCQEICQQEIENEIAEARYQDSIGLGDYAQAARKRKEAAIKLRDKCVAYRGQSVGMITQAFSNMSGFVANKQCATDFAAQAASSPITAPTVGDCSDPNNTSIKCFCEKDANKSAAICAGLGANSASVASTTVPNGTGTSAAPAGLSSEQMGLEGTEGIAGLQPKQGKGGDAPGSGGAGAPGGGGGVGAFASEGGGGGFGGDPKSAITGTSGGQGGGLGGSGGGGGGGLARNGGGGGKESFFDKFNLRKFLPGSKYKTRGIAGMSVKSVDGITGPMGPSIWEKATRQYQEQIQKQNLILDK